MAEHSSNTKLLAVVASVATVLLTLGALWDWGKDAIVSELALELDRISNRTERDIGEVHTHLGCWADASMSPCEDRLTDYITCRYGVNE